MQLNPMQRRFILVFWFLFIAMLQILVLPVSVTDGPWFLYGTDTVSHDAIAQIWFWDQVAEHSGTMPLWISELRGGLPTIGSFFSVPFAPLTFLFALVSFATAQKIILITALFYGGLGGYWLGRAMCLRPLSAILLGTAFCLSGHPVTLIHAGHLQKILAIYWMPWCIGGLFQAFLSSDNQQRIRGAAIAGASIGMMFLSGHPQIAYCAIMITLGVAVYAITKWGRSHLVSIPTSCIGIVVLAGLLGSVQMMPGLEMKQWSNRADGVSIEEAVETSYPPGELAEFFLPRMKGDSSPVGDGVYVGEWGERLVSDYSGACLLFFGLWGAMLFKRNEYSRLFLIILLVSIFVGLGKYTPLYKALYNFWPGMNGFRSPGTFFVAAALAIPALAAIGFDRLTKRLEVMPKSYLRMLGIMSSLSILGYMLANHYLVIGNKLILLQPNELDSWSTYFYWKAFRRSSGFLTLGLLAPMIGYAIGGRSQRTMLFSGLAILLFCTWDLSSANKSFLKREPWNLYSAFLAPNEYDVALLDAPRPLRSTDIDNDSSLRPLLYERDTLLGYHPISFQVYDDSLEGLDFQSVEDRNKLGLQYAVLQTATIDASILTPLIKGPKGVLYQLDEVQPVALVWDHNQGAVSLSESFSPNMIESKFTSLVNGVYVSRQNIAPGWRWRLTGASDTNPWQNVEHVSASLEIDLSDKIKIEREYRPRSYHIGLFLTGMGIFFILFLLLASVGPKKERQ